MIRAGRFNCLIMALTKGRKSASDGAMPSLPVHWQKSLFSIRARVGQAIHARSGSLASLQGLSARGHELYPALRESFSGHDLELDAVLDDPQIGEER